MQVRAMGSDLQIFVATILLLVPLGNPQQTCVQNLPPFVDQEPGSPVLGPSDTNPTIQAIIPQYMFNCSGFVTQWSVAVKMAKTRAMSFQVWRPVPVMNGSPTIYSLVYADRVPSSLSLARGTHTFTITVPSPSRPVMPGDVMGFSYGGTVGDWRVQVNTGYPQIIAYYVTTAEAADMATLNTYTPTAAAPIISAVFQPVSTLLPAQISATRSTALALTTPQGTTAPVVAVTATKGSIPLDVIIQTTISLLTTAPSVTLSGTPVPSNQPLSVAIVAAVLTAILIALVLLVCVALVIVYTKRHRRENNGSVKREAKNQYYTDTVLQTSLVPVDTKTEDGFCTTPQTCLSSSYTDTIRKHVGSSVDSPNHYTLAQSGVLYDCPDDITGQLYTSPLATLVGTDAVEEPNIAVGRYEMVEMNKYDTTTFSEKMYWSPALTVSGLYEQLAAHKYQEIPLAHIRILNVLGSGQFGQVSRGQWETSTVSTEVAIKRLKDGASEEDRVKFLQEAAIMGQFSHPNVVTMFGVVTVGDRPMIVLELMAGDLHSFLIEPTILQKHGQDKLKNIFLRFSQEIAFGMLYLSRKSFVHRDLAARNVLVTKGLTCKIGDFGMARDLIDEVYYASKGGAIPVKWTAPEALLYKKYSTSSDVYSFGMVMYEIWSLGTKPFQDLRNVEVPQLVRLGYCLPPPPGCPRTVYSLMVDCWHPHHDKRPHFDKVVNYLKKPEEVLLFWSKEDSTSAGGGANLGSSLSSSQHLFPDLQNKYRDGQQHC